MQTDWEKRAHELRHEQWKSGPWEIRAALQLGREMADARAEEIAQEIELRKRRYPIVDGFPLIRPLTNTGSRPLTPQECRAWDQEEGARVEWDETGFEIIGAKKKTREQVLEEALDKFTRCPIASVAFDARRALDWKPPS